MTLVAGPMCAAGRGSSRESKYTRFCSIRELWRNLQIELLHFYTNPFYNVFSKYRGIENFFEVGTVWLHLPARPACAVCQRGLPAWSASSVWSAMKRNGDCGEMDKCIMSLRCRPPCYA